MTPMKPMKPMEPMAPMREPAPWWPRDLGDPTSTGAQSDTRYAYFAGPKRLLVESGGKTTLYDTGEHRISGFGQQQASGSDMVFQSDSGRVELRNLRVV